MDEIVVTGTRVANRSRLDTLAPVDVISSDTLQNRGTTELAAALAQAVPSLTFPRPSVTDGTDSIRPATLRGLGPDQTLVLVNGTRRHASALVNVNGSVGRGSAAVDLNAIPSGALDRVEVLRDGASAQYGSDAIAGVVNLRLREADSGGSATVTYGQYDTTVESARASRDVTDGETLTISAWQGLSLGEEGFLTLSAEYMEREPTNRSTTDTRGAANGQVTSRYGDPDVEQLTLFANAGKALNADWEAFGWLGYQDRDSESAAFARLSDNVNNVAAVYPNGFLPKIVIRSEDTSAAAGLRGTLAGWESEYTLVYGENALQYRTEDSINSTYGVDSPTSFDSGQTIYDQLVFGADLTRQFDIGRAEPLNLAVGLEARRETYQIIAGQPESYDIGPLGTGGVRAAGAQGFVGFQPSNEVDVDRDAIGLYADVEIPVTEKLTIGGALRVERYSDFGDTQTGKLSARYDFSPAFALRGTVSTGFRAPSLQQQYYTATSSVIQTINGVQTVVETGTFPATSDVGRVLGGQQLEAETSENYTLGAVLRLGAFDLTLDAYRIDITNQIALSENLQGPAGSAIANFLQPFGVSAARFFLNGVDTTTDGVDIVGRYRLPTDSLGDFNFTVAANFNNIEVTRFPTRTTTIDSTTLFGRTRIKTLEDGTPHEKVSASADWSLGPWGATAKATYYGETINPAANTTGEDDVSSGTNTLIDLELRYEVREGVDLAVGADNLFDEYPDYTPARLLNTNGAVAYPSYSPFGVNGRYVYGRISVNW